MWENFISCLLRKLCDTVGSEEDIRVLPNVSIGVKSMTFWLLVQMLYHKATGDSEELRPLNQALGFHGNKSVRYLVVTVVLK